MARARIGKPIAQGNKPVLTLNRLLSQRAYINITTIKRLKTNSQLNLSNVVPSELASFTTEGCPLSLLRFCHFFWRIG
jgi:hypothetical protein